MASQARLHGARAADVDVSVLILQAVLTGAAAAGRDVDELLSAGGLPPQAQIDPAARIGVGQWARVITRIMSSLNDETLGLLPRSTPRGSFLMVCRALVHCRTVGEAIERYVTFYNLLRTGVTYQYERSGSSVTLRVFPDDIEQIKNVVNLDITLLSFHRLFSWLTSELIQLDRVEVGAPPPPYEEEYTRIFFDAPIAFSCDSYSLTFDELFLQLPIVRTERDLERYVDQFMPALFLPMPIVGSFSRKLRAYMTDESLRSGRMPDLRQISAQFGLRDRAVNRQLKEEGLNFQNLKRVVRRDIAVYYLSRTTDSVERIAAYVGFSEISAFSRAFKQWTGMSPLAYRNAMAG